MEQEHRSRPAPPARQLRALAHCSLRSCLATLALASGCAVCTQAEPPNWIDGQVLLDGDAVLHAVAGGEQRLWTVIEECNTWYAGGWTPAGGPTRGAAFLSEIGAGGPCTEGPALEETVRVTEMPWGALVTLADDCPTKGELYGVLPDGAPAPPLEEVITGCDLYSASGEVGSAGATAVAVFPRPAVTSARCPLATNDLADPGVLALSAFDPLDPSTLVPAGTGGILLGIPPGADLAVGSGWLAVRRLLQGPLGDVIVLYARVEPATEIPEAFGEGRFATWVWQNGASFAVGVSTDGSVLRPPLDLEALVGFRVDAGALEDDDLILAGVDLEGNVRSARVSLWDGTTAAVVSAAVLVAPAAAPTRVLGVFADGAIATVVWHTAFADGMGHVASARVSAANVESTVALGDVGPTGPWAVCLGDGTRALVFEGPTVIGPRTYYVTILD